ncbi:carboxylesterase [Mariprofundus erugo]|uniref:Carboxylesterase n=1 Tax=Mariprofundus erugo TaxID=2528639 RepID=A0A5R9GSZ0_9PROT|nr:dienelactone hydrolase family protein [Mariprofundus erugo]TLS68185.1 carboxylesterase [Mariprofundus erugo]TLS73714.1 carboxylesterase [Mariprofundus erugo]
MSRKVLPHICIETAPSPTATVIWLHGLGADGHDFEPIVPQLGLPQTTAIRFIFPHAPAMPVSINGGYIMPAWYDIRKNDLGIAHDEAGITASADSIAMLIEQENMRGIPNSRIILAGFSQGAAMALHAGLRQTAPLAGIIALSGYLLLPEKSHQFTAESRTTPLFIGHGVDDPVVPFALGDTTARKIRAAGYRLDWHSYPMEHSVCMEEIRHIGQWITARLSPLKQ